MSSLLIEEAEILERFGDDREFLNEVLEDFRGMWPEILEAMRNAMAEGNLRGLAESTHSLKGAAANFSNEAFTAQMQSIESAAKAGDVATATSEFPAFESNLKSLDQEILSLMSVQPEGA
ncbi:MAG: Hpt domain-containing protein [Planctomycetota bacterium]